MRLQLLRTLVVVELLDAVVLLLDVVRLLLLEVLHHPVDLLSPLAEGIETHAGSERREARVAELLRRREKDLLSFVHALVLDLQRLLHLDEVERARERVVGVVRAEDRQRLAAALDLLSAGLLALLVLGIGHLAGLLQVHQELLVRGESVARVLQALHLLLLRGREVRLERLLHLLQDTEDLARLRRVALLERRLRIEVVTRRLDEGSDGLVLRRGGDLRKHVAVLVELPLEGRRDVDERLRRHLRERVVLAQDRDRRLQGADRLEHVLLLRVELGQLLLAKGRRLVERIRVLRDLGLEVLDLGVQARAARRELLDVRSQRRDRVLGVTDRRRLRLVVRRAPASNLLVLIGLLLKLRHHVLDKVDNLRHRTVLVLALGRDRCFGSNEKAKQRKHHALERKTQQERDQTLE